MTALRRSTFFAFALFVSSSLALRAQSPVQRARQLIAADSASEAVNILNTAIGSGHDSSSYHLWRAAAYADQGARANTFNQVMLTIRIKNELKQALKLDSNSVDARSELARFYLTAPSILGGSFARAEELAKSLSTTSPSRSHGLLGFVAHHRGDFKTAEREMRAAIAAQPDSAWSYTPLALLLGEQQRNDEAFALWERSAALDSMYKDSFMQMGIIGANTGTHLDAAARALEHYIGNPPRLSDQRNRASANNRLGIVYEKLGRLNDARRAYQQAVTLAPTSLTFKTSLKNLGDLDAK
ncbi:MAG: tetratricopeptide repeat protein [Gemmatimonadaceae bacterium]